MAFIAGAYTFTFKPFGGSATDFGRTENGFMLMETRHVQEIQTDSMGQGRAGAINQGSTIDISLVGQDYDKFKIALHSTHPQGNTLTSVGLSMATSAGEFVATPKAGTGAALEGAYTFPKVYVSDNTQIAMNSKLRTGPITFHAIPDETTGAIYTVAAVS